MKKYFLMIIPVILLATSFHFANAQAVTDTPGPGAVTAPTPQSQTTNQNLPKLTNPLKAKSITDVIFLAVDIAIYIGSAFAVLALIFVGFKFVEARGNETKLSDAKQWFFYVIIGFAILISSKVIVEIVKTTLTQSGVVDESVWTPPN